MSTTQSISVTSIMRMECVLCDKTIDGHGETAAARYCGAGFCDDCLLNTSPSHTEKARSCFEQRAYSFREHPVLCEINSEVSEVLKYSIGQESDSIAMALIKQCDIATLKESRFDLLCRVIDNIHEGQALKNMPLTNFKKSRRCDKVNTCAGDIVELFRYVSCLTETVPSCLMNKTAPPSYSAVTEPSTTQPEITEMLNNTLRKPIPKPRLRSPPKTPVPSSESSPASPPPPPPSPPQVDTQAIPGSDSSHMGTDSFKLFLNTTPGDSMSLDESTGKPYPKAPGPTASNKTFGIDKTPFHLRFRYDHQVATSSPLNVNAPVFFPPELANHPLVQPHSDPTSNCGHESEIAYMKDMMSEMKSELRRLQCELTTHKEYVNELRLTHPLPPQPSNNRSTNWAAAEEFIKLVNAEFIDKSPSSQASRANLVEISPSQPLASPTVLDESKQVIPQAMKYIQREVEWMIGHMAGQDQRLLDLKMEIGNVKEDFSDRLKAPPLSAPPVQPAQFTFVDPSISTSNMFDVFTDDDVDIYDIPNDKPATAMDKLIAGENKSTSAPKPAPRPKPRPRSKPASKPAPTGDIPTTNPMPVPAQKPEAAPRPIRRPKVKTVGSSMVANQEKHQRARGLDAKAHAHSGEKAQQIQARIIQETSADDEYIVLAGGTNNVPKDYVLDIIRHVGNLIDHTREVRPTQHIIIPQLLHRYDNKYWVVNNEKINRVNSFLRHRCKRDSRMHFLPLDMISRDDLYDNLHLDYGGKDKYAEAVAELIFNLERSE